MYIYVSTCVVYVRYMYCSVLVVHVLYCRVHVWHITEMPCLLAQLIQAGILMFVVFICT